jgi:hypothetical protein
MKKTLMILSILPLMALSGSLSYAQKATSAQTHELSADRHEDQKSRKDAHSHEVKPKSKYDLRDLGGDRRWNSHKHDHRDAHGHDHGDAHKHDHGHAHKHGDSRVHDHGGGPETHDERGHEGHEHGHGHGGHEHGYDRVWHVGISG